MKDALNEAIHNRLCLDSTHTWAGSYCQSCDKRPPSMEYLVLRYSEMKSENDVLRAGAAGKREELAALCHEQWSGWMRYMFSKCDWKGEEKIIPAWATKRWHVQMNTPYSALSTEEKDSDRAEADRFIALLGGA